MFAQKFNQSYYLCRTRGKALKPGLVASYSWFIVKAKTNNSGYIVTRTREIILPKELIGKKVRLKLEIIKD